MPSTVRARFFGFVRFADCAPLRSIACARFSGLARFAAHVPFRAFIIAAFLVCAARPIHAQQSIVTVEQAQRTENRSDEATGRDLILFTGDVVLSITRGGTTVKIASDTVHYDRARDMIYADGNVSMEEVVEGTNGKKLTGSSLLMNAETLKGVFDGMELTVTEPNASGGKDAVLIISSDVFARNESGTAVFKKGSLTFCDDENPHWKVNASRAWLLPGNEFALLNAVFYIGNIPLVYLPFFYYPKDELIFNPSFGYRPRAGYYTQTTTYLIGRKPLDTSTQAGGAYNFVRSNQLMKQRRDGLFLRNLDTPLSADEMPRDYLKLLGDVYSNLGVMTGVEGSFKPVDNFFTSIDFSSLFALSRNVYPVETNALYSPYNEVGKSEWNSSTVFGLKLPIRFYQNVALEAKKAGFNASLKLPLYSDPFFGADFFDRSENMDWLDYFTSSGVTTAEELEKLEKAEVDTYRWDFTASFTPEQSDITPFFNFRVTSLSSNLDWTAKDDKDLGTASVDPTRKFFYPSRIVPLDIRTSVSGTLFTYPKKESAPAAQGQKERHIIEETGAGGEGGGTSAAIDTSVLALMDKPPFGTGDAWIDSANGASNVASTGSADADGTGDAASTGSADADAASNVASTGSADADAASNGASTSSADADGTLTTEILFPILPMPQLTVTEIGGVDYTLSYDSAPFFTSLYAYSPDSWKKAGDKAWKDYMSDFYSVSARTNLKSAFGYKNGFFSLSNTLTFLPQYQKHTNINPKYYTTQAARDQILKSDYMSRKLDITSTNTVAIKPFVLTDMFAKTSFTYNATFKLFRTEFTGTAQAPEWEYKLTDFTDKSFTVHNITAYLSAKQERTEQAMTVVATLPPLLPKYTVKTDLVFPYVTAKMESGYAVRSKTDDSWYIMPFVEQLSVQAFSNAFSLSQSYKYTVDKKQHEYLNVQAAFKGFSFSYSNLFTNGYTYSAASGWKNDGEKKFRPYQATLSYNTANPKTYYWWKNRISFSPSLSTSLVADFLRPPNSYFTFSPSFTFSIFEFLDIKFSSQHRNDVVFRYIQDNVDYSPKIPGETDWWSDLLDSFAFAEEEKRRASGFKLKSLELEVNHNLHDWNVNSVIRVSPRLVEEGSISRYDYSPYFSLSVIWKPMDAVKARIVDEYGTVEINP